MILYPLLPQPKLCCANFPLLQPPVPLRALLGRDGRGAGAAPPASRETLGKGKPRHCSFLLRDTLGTGHPFRFFLFYYRFVTKQTNKRTE